MTTTTSSTIGTGGTYSTWADWFSAAPADLTVADVIWQGRQLNQEFVSAGTIVNLTGKTADAARYFEMTADTGVSFNDHVTKATNALRYNAANGASLRVTGDNASAVRCSIPYTRISKLQFSSTTLSTNTFPVVFRENSGSIDINQCIVEGFCSGTAYPGLLKMFGGTAGDSFLRNSVLISKASNIDAIIASISNGCEIHNSTLVSLNAVLTSGIKTTSLGLVLKNTYIGGCVTPITSATITPVTTNCAASATASGYTTVPMSAATFQNVANGTHDFRLAIGSALVDAGVADPTYAAVGILGTTRPQGAAYDIGAYELPVAPDTTPPTMTGSLTSSSVTPTGFTINWSGTTRNDNVAITGFETSLDGSVWTDRGNVTSAAFTTLNSSTLYNPVVRAYDAAGYKSTPTLTIAVTTNAPVAPGLAAPTATPTSSTAVTGTVGTDTGGGTLYYLTSINASETVAVIKASGGTQAVTATGTRTVYVSGLTPGATYYLHFVQVDGAATPNTSLVAKTTSFTMPAADTAAPTFANGSAITPGTITASALAFAYPAATDNVAVAKYQTSKDSGSNWQDNGTGLSGTFSGLTSSTTFPIWVRAVDAQNNFSTPLQLPMTTLAGATNSFVGDAWLTSAETIRASQTFTGTWYSGGVVGAAGGTATLVSGTLSATGIPTLTGLPAGAGFLLGKATDGSIVYEAGTVV